MKRTFFATLILMIYFSGLFEAVQAQEPGKTEMREIFKKFKNYRFGSVALYEITAITEIRKAIEARDMASSGATAVDESALKGIPKEIQEAAYRCYVTSQDKNSVGQCLAEQNIEFTDDQLNVLHASFEAKRNVGGGDKISYVYVITTKPKMGKSPETIIAMIPSTASSNNLDKALKNVGNSSIYLYDDLKQFPLDSSYSASNMYDLIANSFVQMNIKNRTTEMQGIGTPGFFYTRNFGIAQSLVSNEADLQSWDIQRILQISDIQPHKMGINQNEVILSPDLISWKHYALPLSYETDPPTVDTAYGVSNSDLPQYGLELKYGIDEINYSSFWSERLTAYALWSSVKLGVILPTSGWSYLGKDLFSQQRNMTFGSAGVAGKFDFPIKIVPKSGLFSMSFGYVFGDAKENDYKKGGIKDLYPDPNVIDTNMFPYSYKKIDMDYLVRYNFNIHYTFGLSIDEDYKFRFGVGFTGYGVEEWYNKIIEVTNEENVLEKKYSHELFNSEFIAGLSGKIEFMVTNITTPYGASLQYFDESISGGIWLQIPLYKNNFALRLEAKGFAPLFRGTDHNWEVGGYFTPMARLIVNF